MKNKTLFFSFILAFLVGAIFLLSLPKEESPTQSEPLPEIADEVVVSVGPEPLEEMGEISESIQISIMEEEQK